jgi:hypothetical protein
MDYVDRDGRGRRKVDKQKKDLLDHQFYVQNIWRTMVAYSICSTVYF